MGFEGFPLVIGWELTLSCNIRCRHCASSAGSPRVQELTLDEVLAICDQFPELLVQEVDFTGGEPLLRPDWARIISHLTLKGIPTKILTNGLILGPRTIAKMKDAGVAGVGISLDGLEATHDYVRGHPKLFRSVITGIERLLHQDMPVTVITTVNALNVGELSGILALLRSIGVKRWRVQPFAPSGRGRDSRELFLSQEAYHRIDVFFAQCMAELAGSDFQLAAADSCGYFSEFEPPDQPWLGCTAGLTACGIMSDGKVKGCLSLPDNLVEGDLRTTDLWDIWFNPDAFAYTRKFAQADMGPLCSHCPKSEQCRGGCSAMSYTSTGLFHNDPYCFYRTGAIT